MRKLILMMSMTLDGFIEGPDGELDWASAGDDYFRHVDDLLASMSAFLHGRRVYENMASYWPTADARPDSTPRVAAFARLWREMPKLVFSRTLERVDWNSTLVREVDPAQLRALQARPGGDMVVGGADLGASFLRHDLIDEMRIYVHPVAIGRGKPLFQPSTRRIPLRLAQTRAFESGVVLLRYERALGPGGD
jgi:dihydrofolate reductase